MLFFIGLLQGGVLDWFHNPRMALSAHLTAAQGGMAVMIAGLVWPLVALSARLERVARWFIITGVYLLWGGLTLSAATGASQMLPIAGAGYSATNAIELGVAAIILMASGLLILGWLLLVVGIAR